MNGIEALLRGWVQAPGAAALGRTLLHSLWEGAAVALALAAVLTTVRSSRVRYGAACAAMIVLLGGLVVTFARLAPESPVKIRAAGTGRVPAIPPGPGVLPPITPNEGPAPDSLA